MLEEKDFLFRNVFRTSQAYRGYLSEVSGKWPDFLEGILPRMSTIFQLSVVKCGPFGLKLSSWHSRHRASGKILVVANTSGAGKVLQLVAKALVLPSQRKVRCRPKVANRSFTSP